jgi:hypothetical protein
MSTLFGGVWVVRFWSKVNKFGPVVRPELGPCWVWKAANSGGYGYVRHPDLHRMFPAHRIAYELGHGVIDVGLDVCHKCDNPICVRPTHLFQGTALDNSHDALRKDRKGVKLTLDQVAQIRHLLNLGLEQGEIGVLFGVDRSMICKINRNRNWRKEVLSCVST